ncbi:MAG: hypothetical protein WAM97_06400 [Acidimicrobiales bacterium]
MDQSRFFIRFLDETGLVDADGVTPPAGSLHLAHRPGRSLPPPQAPAQKHDPVGDRSGLLSEARIPACEERGPEPD